MLKVSAVVVDETQTRMRNNELAVFSDEDTRGSAVTDARAYLVTPMDGLANALKLSLSGLVARWTRCSRNLPLYDPRAACEKLINPVVSYFTALSVETSAVLCAGSVSADAAVSLCSITLMDLDAVPSGSVPLPSKAGEANAIEENVADFIGDKSLSHPSMSQAVNALFLAGRMIKGS